MQSLHAVGLGGIGGPASTTQLRQFPSGGLPNKSVCQHHASVSDAEPSTKTCFTRWQNWYEARQHLMSSFTESRFGLSEDDFCTHLPALAIVHVQTTSICRLCHSRFNLRPEARRMAHLVNPSPPVPSPNPGKPRDLSLRGRSYRQRSWPCGMTKREHWGELRDSPKRRPMALGDLRPLCVRRWGPHSQ